MKNSDLKKEVDLIENIKKLTDLVLVVFAKPCRVSDLEIDDIESIVIGYQNSEVFQQKAAQVIFGAIPAKEDYQLVFIKIFLSILKLKL